MENDLHRELVDSGLASDCLIFKVVFLADFDTYTKCHEYYYFAC